MVDPPQVKSVSYLFSTLLSWGEGGAVGRIFTVDSEYSTYYSSPFGPNNE